MCVRRYLGFVLLVWFQGVLHVQTSDQPCSAPSLNGGYWVLIPDSNNHETKLTYGCNNGRKPAVEGWWATSTCTNGIWSPKPQCIDEKACMPPTIPNAIYTVSTNGWYEENAIVSVTCDNGYEDKLQDATAQCINGSWSSVPVCEKSINACGEPPQISHAVIILQEYQDFFAAETKLEYECEDEYTVDGVDTKTFIYCRAGTWTDGPVCSKWGSGPGTGHMGSRGPDTSASGKQTETGVNNCGDAPVVLNGDLVENGQIPLRYQCSSFYKLVGPEGVVCRNDGSWSEAPRCKANFCSVDTDQKPDLIPAGVKYIRNGQSLRLPCVKKRFYWVSDHYSVWQCTDGKSSFSKCCGWLELNTDLC